METNLTAPTAALWDAHRAARKAARRAIAADVELTRLDMAEIAAWAACHRAANPADAEQAALKATDRRVKAAVKAADAHAAADAARRAAEAAALPFKVTK